jgi:hypothetical protein
MNKQILIISTLIMGAQATAFGMNQVKTEVKADAEQVELKKTEAKRTAAVQQDTQAAWDQAYRDAQETIRNAPRRTTPRAEDYPTGSPENIRLAAEEKQAADNKRAAEANVRPVQRTHIRRYSLPNGKFQQDVIPNSNVEAYRANKKNKKAIEEKERQKRSFARKISHEKDVLWKSTGALALTIFICMHMHKHNHIERIAEHFGPMAAHAVQVMATLALGTSAKTMWDAGMNAYSKIPQRIKQLDEEIISKKEAKSDQSVFEEEPARETIWEGGPRPWPKQPRVETEPDVAPAPQAPATPSSAEEKVSAAAAVGLGLSSSSPAVPVSSAAEPRREAVNRRVDANGKIVEE